MSEATRFKDVQAEVKNMDERLKEFQSETLARIEAIENHSATRFEFMEAQAAARYEQLTATIEALGRSQIMRNEGMGTFNRHGHHQYRYDDRMHDPPPNHHTARHIKLDFPKFNGDDPMTWIFRAEQYFSYYGTPDFQRVIVASVNFEGDVVPWFQLLQKSRVITDWLSLIKAIEDEYGPSIYEKPRTKLFKLQQSGTADDFCKEFVALANRTEGISDEAMLDCFTGGLKPEVRREVLAQNPRNLLRAAELARLFDVKLGPTSSAQHGGRSHLTSYRAGTPAKSPFSTTHTGVQFSY